MKVILLKDVPKVGRKNEVRDVSDGYGRNFLIARGFAIDASISAIRTLDVEKRNMELSIEAETSKLQSIAEKLKTIELSYVLKLGKVGESFGSIGTAKILDSLKERGVLIERDWLSLPQALKTLGIHKLSVNFPFKISSYVTVKIERSHS